MQGRASRSKRGGSAPAGATLPHGSAVTKVNVPELVAQAAALPGSDKLTALAEQVANMKAEADAAQAHSFRQLEQMAALLQHVVSQLPAPATTPVPAAEPPAAPTATPTLQQQEIAHIKQRFDAQATIDAAVAAAVAQINAARDAATSTPPPPRAASYSSAAAPRAPAGYRVPAPPPPPPPPPTPPALSYGHSLSTDRLVPVKSATMSMVKCFKINLDSAGMHTQTLAVTSFIIAHDTRMDGFLEMDDPTFAGERRLGGAYAEWLVATDAMLANAILGSLERSSTHVQNFISEFGQDAGLVSSGRALLKHFMRLYHAESGFEQYQAEEDLKAFAPLTMGAGAADSIKHGYGLVECYGRLFTTRLLLPLDLLKGQTRLLLNKLPDTIPEKRVIIKAFFRESRSGVPRWETLHAVIKEAALMLVPDAPFAPVVNAAFTPRGFWICAATGHSARECTETCSECNFKFCPAAKPGTPRAPCAVNASAAPVAHKITNALGGRPPDVIFQGLLDRWRAKHLLTAHTGESRSEEEINIAEFELEQARYLQANSAACSGNFEVNFVPRANPSIYEDNDETDGVIDVSCADGAPMRALWGAVTHDALAGLV